MKRTRIVISVVGGNVNGIFSNNLNSEVYLLDYDNLVVDPDHDCRQPVKVGTFEDLGSVVSGEARSFHSAAELADHVRR
jgi:hypothetical protein